jgi:protein tyrosine/serine phosphatase
LFSPPLSQADERGLPAQHGILNFGKVDDRLYRGAQPDATAIANLNELGVRMVINLRMPDDVRKTEEAEARTHGMLSTNVPMAGLAKPTDDQVQRVLALIQTAPGPVFVHCEHGCDRTGTIIACYRIQHDRWSNSAALREAELYGLSKLELGMREYIMRFKPKSSP